MNQSDFSMRKSNISFVYSVFFIIMFLFTGIIFTNAYAVPVNNSFENPNQELCYFEDDLKVLNE